MTFIFLLITALSAEAQQTKKLPRLCYFGSSAPEAKKSLDPFHKRLLDLGYVEEITSASNIVTSREKSSVPPELTAALVRIRCDIILTISRPDSIARNKARADAILVLGGPVTTFQRRSIAELAAKNRMPAIYPQSDYMDAGGLMFYGVSVNDLFRRAAIYVDKILKGAKPADLPVEQPTKFELVINLNTAKQLGLAIPPNVLARADRVIR